MKKFLFYFILCFLTICLVPQLLIAKTGYVSDLLLLTFRDGPARSYPVKKTLKSSTPVTIIEEQDGFYKVELESKEIGWVDKKFIIFEIPKSLIIKQLEQDIKSLEKKIGNLESASQVLNEQLSSSNNENVKKIQSLEKSLQSSLNENKTLTRSLSKNKKKYSTLVRQSKNIQNIITENTTLKQENQSLTTTLAALEKKNKSILKIGMIKWFLAGVGTILLGWILGHSISSRRRSGDSLL